MDEIKRLVSLANDRLRSGKIGVSLEVQGRQDWLYLRGTFPPRPGSGRAKPSQTRISLKMKALDRASVKEAEMIARTVGLDLNLGRFDWEKFSGQPEEESTVKTIAQWVTEYEDLWWQDKDRTSRSHLSTWTKAHWYCLKRLPQDKEISVDVLIDWVVENTDPKTRRRQQYCTAAKTLCKMAGLPQESFVELSKGHPSKPINPRDLPTDEMIAAIRGTIDSPEWRWIYGLMAVYGLRNHECCRLEFDEFPTLKVVERQEDGIRVKTGERYVEPLYPEWAIDWKLSEQQYPYQLNPDEPDNERLGTRIRQNLGKWIDFTPYNLRHAFARRCFEFDIPPDKAARLMGHSEGIHRRVYQAWIDRRIFHEAAKEIIYRSDRPMPPGYAATSQSANQ